MQGPGFNPQSDPGLILGGFLNLPEGLSSRRVCSEPGTHKWGSHSLIQKSSGLNDVQHVAWFCASFIIRVKLWFCHLHLQMCLSSLDPLHPLLTLSSSIFSTSCRVTGQCSVTSICKFKKWLLSCSSVTISVSSSLLWKGGVLVGNIWLFHKTVFYDPGCVQYTCTCTYTKCSQQICM